MGKKRRPPSIQRQVNKYAGTIGQVCIDWARVERHIDNLLAMLIPLESGDTSRSVTGNIDFREKLQMLRALAFIHRPSNDWFKYLLELINHIDNDLRPRRNEYVHGGVFLGDGRLVRREHKTRFYKPQAFQLTLSTGGDIPLKLRELKSFHADLRRSVFELWDLVGDLNVYSLTRGPGVQIELEPSPPIRFARSPRRAKSGGQKRDASRQ